MTRRSAPARAGLVGSGVGGAVLATATGVVAALRPAAKPLHPRGAVSRGVLSRSGGRTRTGVPLLDDPGEDEVLVRESRAVGLPGPVPDVHGVAVRLWPDSPRPADLLFASTGLGRVTRFVLTASVDPGARPMTTLLPYRTQVGPVLLAAEAETERRWRLSWARPRGGWTRFGALVLAPGAEADAPVSFDPVLWPVPGLDSYDWVRRLREPAYVTARRSRLESRPHEPADQP